MWNNPKGTGTKQLDVIREKCDEWAGFVTNGYLPRQSVWTAFWVQLWPALKYGIGMNAFQQQEMKSLLYPNIYKFYLAWAAIVKSRRNGVRSHTSSWA